MLEPHPCSFKERCRAEARRRRRTSFGGNELQKLYDMMKGWYTEREM